MANKYKSFNIFKQQENAKQSTLRLHLTLVRNMTSDGENLDRERKIFINGVNLNLCGHCGTDY